MSTFAITRQGPGGTTDNAVTQIGTDITMPAGGPHIIHGVACCVVHHTPTLAQSLQGYLRMLAASGDLDPDPAPAKFPCVGLANSSSANMGVAVVPTNIYRTNYSASGKAIIQLSYVNSGANTVAPEILASLIFGDKIPAPGFQNFIDQVDTTFASAAEQLVGTITLSEKAKRITGVLAVGFHAGAMTASEEVMGWIRLDSQDMKLQPAEFPFSLNCSAGLATVAGQASSPHLPFIDVDIPVTGGAIINVYATTSISVTASARVQAFLAYE